MYILKSFKFYYFSSFTARKYYNLCLLNMYILDMIQNRTQTIIFSVVNHLVVVYIMNLRPSVAYHYQSFLLNSSLNEKYLAVQTRREVQEGSVPSHQVTDTCR